jgi:hypothetical protein
MRGAYGKPYGLAARVTINQIMFSIRTTLKGEDHACEALRKVFISPSRTFLPLCPSSLTGAVVYRVNEARTRKILLATCTRESLDHECVLSLGLRVCRAVQGQVPRTSARVCVSQLGFLSFPQGCLHRRAADDCRGQDHMERFRSLQIPLSFSLSKHHTHALAQHATSLPSNPSSCPLSFVIALSLFSPFLHASRSARVVLSSGTCASFVSEQARFTNESHD